MPILETGIWKARSGGFTLLEVLVALVIIGILTGMAVLAVGGVDTQNRLHDEARRLVQRLDLYHTEAILRGEQRALLVRPDGYQFLALDGAGRWMPVLDSDPQGQRLPDDWRLALSVEGRALRLGENPTAPQILLLASGEMSDFQLSLSVDDSGYTISGELTGRLRLDSLP